MRKLLLFLTFAMSMAYDMAAQKVMSPPVVMIVPDNIYCKEHGFVQTFDNQGSTETVPDYEKAVTQDQTLYPVLIQIAELIKERNSKIEIIDLMTAINNLKTDMTMDSNNGGDDTESIDEAIIRNSMADILVKVNFNVLRNGPQKQIQYTITGTDAYTGRNFAPVTGVGAPSTSTSTPLLVREAIFGKMDDFLTSVLRYYTNMADNGRAIALNFKIQSGSSINMDSRVGEYLLKEEIDDCLYDLSVDGNGLERVQGGKTFLTYTGVYFPLTTNVRGRERKQSASHIAQKVCNYLESNFQINCYFKTIGLGKANIYITK